MKKAKILLSFMSMAVMALGPIADARAQVLSPTSNSSSSSNSAAGANSQSGSGAAAIINQTSTSPANTTNTTTLNERVSGGTNSTITQGGYTSSDVTVRSAPQVYVPSVITGNVCAIGASAGASFIGTGFAIGASWESMQCERRQTAALLWNMNTPESRAAAKEVICNSPEIRAAYRQTGSPCSADYPQPAPGQPVVIAPRPAPVPVRMAFNPAMYPTGAACLNAAQDAGAPFSECRGKP